MTMNKYATMFVAVILLAGCGGGAEQAAAPEVEARQSWAVFAASVVAENYRRNPESAVDAGLHEYDGQISDMSLEALADQAEWLNSSIDAAAGYSELDGTEAFERDYLIAALSDQLFSLQDTGFAQSNPLFYAGRLGMSVYIDREYAPVEERIKAYTTYASQVPGLLQTMQQNLQPPLPAPYVEVGHGIFSGLADYLENTVPELFSAVDDEQLLRQFDAANGAAAAAAQQAADWLDGLKATATDDFALGEDQFLKMLRDSEGVDISLADLKAAGQLDLDRNANALNEACAQFAPGASTKDCVMQVQNRKSPEGPVGGAQRQLPGLRKFLEDNRLVTIPGTEDALVDEAPPHRRFNLAYIDIPGPFESGLPSVYYIAPPDPEWSEEDRLAYVPGETSLLAVSIHEVWPGHFLQYLHSNRTENNIGRHFGTYTFGEGWAHYTEQMMLDAGLGEGDPEVKIGQLLQALWRNVRYMSAIGLHTEGMSVEESKAMFEEQAFLDPGNAMQQANRGTYDPGYLNYTLGKLMINKLRSDWTAGRGGQEAWGAYHDQFLSYGSPPIPLIRQQMLGDDFEGDVALLPQ
jgi:hypothetical protein